MTLDPSGRESPKAVSLLSWEVLPAAARWLCVTPVFGSPG